MKLLLKLPFLLLVFLNAFGMDFSICPNSFEESQRTAINLGKTLNDFYDQLPITINSVDELEAIQKRHSTLGKSYNSWLEKTSKITPLLTEPDKEELSKSKTTLSKIQKDLDQQIIDLQTTFIKKLHKELANFKKNRNE